ncbi:MAG: dihydrofolate reductase family protein [Pseudomonadota bacterium]
MTRVHYQGAISIDGFIAPEDGSVAWLEPYRADGAEAIGAFMKGIGGAIVGRATYDLAVSMGGAALFGRIPTLIMTSRPVEPAPPDTMIVAGGEPAAALAKLRSAMKSGDIWLMGGGITAASFLDAGLIDTINLIIIPILLGRGRPLLAGGPRSQAFRLSSTRAGKLGTVSTIYEKA